MSNRLTLSDSINQAINTGKEATFLYDGTLYTFSPAGLLDFVATEGGATIEGVTASADEINILDGATLDVNELNILDGVTATAAELSLLAGAGAAVASGTQVALITDASEAHALNEVFDDVEAEAALDALGAKINLIIAALEAFGIAASA